jgi:hypothetical protein
MLIINEQMLIGDSRKMNHRLVVVALAAFGFGAASSQAQSALADPSASTNQSNQAIVAPKDKDPCGGYLDSTRKANCFAHRSLSIGTLIGPLFMAVPEIAKPTAGYPKQWRQGPAAFGRLYGDALALQTVQQTSRFLAGVALHEDLRYYPATSRNPLRRAFHAITFAAFDQSDSGRTTLAASNFLGSAAGAFVGYAYLPRGYNDTSHAVTRMEFQFGFFLAENLVNEFRPELRHLQKTLHLPGHRDAAVRRGD